MAILPLNLARVSNQLRTSIASRQISQTQAQLLQVQNELSSGKRLNLPSDNPGDAAIVIQLRKTLDQRAAYSANLKEAQGQLSEVDTTLGDLTDLVRQAKQIASANVGSDVTPDARLAAAAVINSIYNQAISIGNKQFNGVYLFAGDRSNSAPFISSNGGVQYVGSNAVLRNQYDESTVLPFMVSGSSVFGGFSGQVTGNANLVPNISSTTRLIDLGGARGNGVSLGSIQIGNGSVNQIVDLSGAGSIQDVISKINSAAVGGITASIALGGGGLQLNAGASDNITVTESGGSTAADLGLLMPTGAGVGVKLTGSSVAAKVTPLTPLVSLRGGAGLDNTGFKITNGTATATISLSGVSTVEGLLNAINGANLGVKAQINSSGTGIDVLNANQGTAMTISEVGGTTATELGIRSMGPGTLLSDLNGGKGVKLGTGNDLSFNRKDGTTFGVDLDGAATVQDVIDRINTADAGGGLTASFATTGNGIVLTDATSGPGSTSVVNANGSTALTDLGLAAAPVAGVITGTDVNSISVNGVFANLAKLRNSLLNNSQSGITDAATGLAEDESRVVRVRGETGARVQELDARQNSITDQNVATKALMSSLEDTDFTDAISRYQTLQTALQASLETSGRMLNLSLMDYLK